MPRRANFAVTIQDPPALQQDPKTKNLSVLRTQWRWAAFSQFFVTFFPLFSLSDVSVSDIEQDLVGNTRHVLPRIMQKLLYSLSYDRKVSVDNWQTALRKQYNRRAPDSNPIGPEPPSAIPSREDDIQQDSEKSSSNQADKHDTSANEPTLFDMSLAPTPLIELNSTRQSSVAEEQRAPSSLNDVDSDLHPQQKTTDWFDLPMLAKLESMHTVAEWQFQNPTRLRTVMKCDDELAAWRIEPIGYDSKGNGYWLMGADRLWIQRVPPKPQKTLKRKRPSQIAFDEQSAQKAKKLKVNSPEKPSSTHLATSPDRHSRAAKDQAKKRLDAQAKELAELNRQASLANFGLRKQGSSRSASTTIPQVIGTRSSARLRGTQDNEWQPIPEEWLKEVDSTRPSGRLEVKTGLETDMESVSELTELSEDDSEPVSVMLEQDVNGHGDTANEHDEDAVPEQGPGLDDFVEWETICSTVQEWEHIADRFEKATHYSEKALYKMLVNNIVPIVIQELRENDRKRQLEEAVVHRKRSSRIALRESEKEVARSAIVKKQEEAEKMSRARRLEARKQREEEERIKREHARELRRQERETKEEIKKETEEAMPLVQPERPAKKRKSSSPTRETRKSKTRKPNWRDTSSGSRTPVGEDWELACDICLRQGTNLDDGTPMMSCGICSRWQHIQCHDRADRIAGRPRRNWNSEEFICKRCSAAPLARDNDLPPTSKQVNMGQTLPIPVYAPSQTSSSSAIYHQDPQSSSQYFSAYDNPLLQDHYGRSNSQQYPNTQNPSNVGGHSILSFSHYQPSEHIFLPSAPKPSFDVHPNVQSLYTNANNSNNVFHPTRRDYTQTSHRSANGTQSPGKSAHSILATALPYIPSSTDNHNLQPGQVHTYSNHEPQTSYTRYSPDNSTGYKQPVSYQTSSHQ